MTTEQAQLPSELQELLDGTRLDERSEHVFELLTVSQTGWPHVALLSVGEVLCRRPDEVVLALWSTSNTTANLRGSGRAVLQLFHGGAAYRARLVGREATTAQAEQLRLALFLCRVERVTRDAVSYARLTSGPRIELAEPQRVVARWAAAVAMLRELA